MTSPEAPTARTAADERSRELTLRLDRAAREAIAERSKLPREVLELPGYSSARVRHFLNMLSEGADTRYLEIGTFQGSTLIAASHDNPGTFVGIDDFSEFRFRQWRSPRRALRSHLERFREHCPVEFIEGDAWSLEPSRLPEAVNVYFYDGPHSERDHIRAFTKYRSSFETPFLAVVDDWNWERVRSGTYQGLAAAGLRVVSESAFRSQGNRDRRGWWNGLWAAVLTANGA